MAAFTCLHPYQDTRAIASQRDMLLFDARHRRGLCANTRSYPCNLLATGALITGALDLIALADIASSRAARGDCCHLTSLPIDLFDPARDWDAHR
jgi:hypothetical protein